MRVPLSWLNDYVDISSTPEEELKNRLFSCGFEVEEVIHVNDCVSGIVTCKILQKANHPAADKLFICQVDAGKYGLLQIVTNARNVSEGDIVPVAISGATLADGTAIKNGKLRGVESFGMFCGGAEIGITDEYYDGASGDSVLIFHDDFPLGEDVSALLGIKDTIFDISVTANRPDCQSIFGIAREVAAALNLPLKMPQTSYSHTDVTTESKVKVSVLDTTLCPRYMATYVDEVKIGPSPKWMQKRLYLMGMRAINNIVDITNYVLCEIGQPMHAFNYAGLAGAEIIVRRAEGGEKIVTLDEKEFSLNSDVLVICDKDKPACLAGIMGGLGSGISNETSSIVFESAVFKRDNIRRNSRKLNQRSDSSSRFEKGLDTYTTELGMKRALALVDMLGAGKIASTTTDINNAPRGNKVINTTLDKINKLLGIEVPHEVISNILSSLNFSVSISGNNLSVTVPQYREDVEDYPDIAEEVIRMYGYDHIESKLLENAAITYGGRNHEQYMEQYCKDYLRFNGYNEVITYSFISPKDYSNFGLDPDDKNLIRLMNPLGEDLSIMRTTLIPSVVMAAVRNINKKNLSGRLFELAKVYLAKKIPLTELPDENRMLCLVTYGNNEDFFTLKGIITGLLENQHYSKKLKLSIVLEPFLHPTRAACYTDEDGNVVAYFGQLHPTIAEKLGVDKPLYVAEIDYEKLSAHFDKGICVKQFSKFPSIERDLALICNLAVSNADITDAIESAHIKNLINVELFDVYTGDRIASDKKSMAYRLTFSSNEKTLADDEVDNYIRKILLKLDSIGVKLREC